MARSLSYSTRLGKTMAGWFQLLKVTKQMDSDGKSDEEPVCLYKLCCCSVK